MAQIDQALIDLAVSHGYTEKQARDYYANQASDDNSAVSSAAKQGQQNIANQDKALAKLPEPDLKGAIALAPAVGNIVKSNAETTAKSAISSATNMFQNLDASDVIQGALEAAGAYAVYKTLKNKMTNNSSSTSTIPTTPDVPTNPVNPATNAPSPSASTAPATPAPSGITNLQQRFRLVPNVELSPEELRQRRLNAAGAAAEQEMKANVAPISAEGAQPLIPATPPPSDAPPVKVEPPPAPPAPPPASASPVPTPDTAIVNNQTGATPADKAVAIVNAPETSTAGTTTETPKVAGAVEPKTKNVLAFPNVPEPVIPPGTPANARRTPSQMEIFKQENPLNKGYTQIAAASGITPKTPPEEARNFMNRVTEEVFGGKPPTSQGGAAPQAKQITNFIETNAKEFPNIYERLKEIQARYPTQSGFAHLQMLGSLGLNVLGGLGLYHDYKEGKKTGDWSNFGLNSIGQVLGNVLPKTAGIGTNLMLHSEEAGRGSALYGPGTPYKNYAEFEQATKIGAGRGMQGVPPPTR